MTSNHDLLSVVTGIIAITGATEITLRLSADDAIKLARDADLAADLRQSRWRAEVTGAIPG